MSVTIASPYSKNQVQLKSELNKLSCVTSHAINTFIEQQKWFKFDLKMISFLKIYFKIKGTYIA